MPNLNLKGGAPAPVSGVRSSGRPDGSGDKKMGGLPISVIVVLVVVIVLGGGYFALHKAGIIGKKKAAPVVMVPPPAVTPDTAAAAMAVPESEGLVEFKEKPAVGSEKNPASKAGMKSSMASAASAATTMAPKIPMSDNGRYSVQISSWASEQKAKLEADIMTQAGYPSFVEKANVWGSEKRFRVYVGRYDSGKAARSSAEKIAQMLEGGYWVVRLSK